MSFMIASKSRFFRLHKLAMHLLGAHATLVCRRDFHIFSIFSHGAPSDLNTLSLEPGSNLFVCQRMCWALISDHLFHPPLHDKERGSASGRTLHGFRKEIAQFEDTLGRVSIFVRYGPA